MVVAYDDNVIIMALDKKQLNWSVRQYKQVTKEPSLATANKSFAKLTRQEDRPKDALTMWANPASIFAVFEKQAKDNPRRKSFARKIQQMDELFDFENIEGVAVRVVINEKNPFLEATCAFKEGHSAILG